MNEDHDTESRLAAEPVDPMERLPLCGNIHASHDMIEQGDDDAIS